MLRTSRSGISAAYDLARLGQRAVRRPVTCSWNPLRWSASAARPSERGTTLTAFTADVSSALAGPAWLTRRRAEAWERFATTSLPQEAEEVWRYSGIDRFDLDAFAPPAPSRPGAQPGIEVGRAMAEPFGRRSALVVTYNGAIVAVDRAPTVPHDQLLVTSVLADPGAPTGLGDLAPAHDAFGQLHDAFVADVVHILVPRKVVLPHPVVVVHLVEATTSSGSTSVFPRSLVHVGSSAEAGVIELIASVDPGTAQDLSRPPW